MVHEVLKQMTAKRIPEVVLQPAVYRGMQRGINQLAEAVRPTMGPLRRVVAIDRVGLNRMPELLDSGRARWGGNA
ncbi:MAG: hypothetical protein CEE40_05670 [Chloroflexi bacterium B3_Chlor]|nr:MAG: hypothetical protein CEE40_05670 [Chloroflexi bacterium B3_Chlor]